MERLTFFGKRFSVSEISSHTRKRPIRVGFLADIAVCRGVSPYRLELIEDRLKRDVLAEIKAGDGQILLHSERADGAVVAVWESVDANNVATLREVMESLIAKEHFSFRRIPITAEGSVQILPPQPLLTQYNSYRPPNFADVAELVEIFSLSPLGHSVIVNCQLGNSDISCRSNDTELGLLPGRGRSTLVSIMLALFRHWLERGGKMNTFSETPQTPPKVLAYAVINNVGHLM